MAASDGILNSAYDDETLPAASPRAPFFDPEKPPEAIEAEYDPDNAANPLAVRTKARLQKARERERLLGLKTLLNTVPGRAWFMEVLLDHCQLMGATENAAYDSNALHFREGARAVGLELQRMALRADEQLYMVALQEHLPKVLK